MIFLITGGAGFIGSAVVRFLINETDHQVVNLDKLTYAGNLKSLDSVSSSKRYQFVHGDISDQAFVSRVLTRFKPDIVMHLAAESHVDNSIDSPSQFVETNIVGTYVLLEQSLSYWSQLEAEKKTSFRFHHISTDEVYGDLPIPATSSNGKLFFTEETAYKPSSPYSASKASSDHLVRAWYRTYGLPTLITNCSNNYGPYQLTEKLIPLVIKNALECKPLPVYGDGKQIRDWLYVVDHVRALYKVATEGQVGDTYNIGGHNEESNMQVVELICELLEELYPPKLNTIAHYKDLISFVKDRPGHDLRYAIDASKIKRNLGWVPQETFESGMRKTVKWYLANKDWWQRLHRRV